MHNTYFIQALYGYDPCLQSLPTRASIFSRYWSGPLPLFPSPLSSSTLPFPYLPFPPLSPSPLHFSCPSIPNLPSLTSKSSQGIWGIDVCFPRQWGPGRSPRCQSIGVFWEIGACVFIHKYVKHVCETWHSRPICRRLRIRIWASPTPSQNLVGSTMGWTL